MIERTLITTDALRALLARGAPLVLLDCGFDLADVHAGARVYTQGHLPGAHRADLEHDLSAPRTAATAATRCPRARPSPRPWRAGACRPDTPVVCYDDQGGPYAARAWWMLRWLGHEAVAVLDGGRAAWLAGGGTLDSTIAGAQRRGALPADCHAMPWVAADRLLAPAGQGDGARRARRRALSR